MTEAEWLACRNPEQLLGYLKNGSGRAKIRKLINRQGCERKLRLFMVACARRNWSWLSDQRSAEAIKVAERFADGLADISQLNVAHAAAVTAYRIVRVLPNRAVYCAACAAAEASQLRAKLGFSSYIYGADVAVLASAASHDIKGVTYDKRIQVTERAVQTDLLRDLFGNPFRPVLFHPEWRTDTARAMARQMYESRDFSAMPILADTFQDAGCNSADVLDHCRDQGTHVRGCWVVDAVLGQG